VIVLFDADATAKDGHAYRGTYTWYFRMRGGRVVDVTAFLDTRELEALLSRVSPDQ
jgi:uncharacterized protein